MQLPKDYELSENGVKLRSRWKALDSVGLYVPGGQTVYPSSLIMNIVPAILAGVKRIVCVTPPSKFHNPYILGLLDELGIEEVYQVGGAQAIGAAYLWYKNYKSGKQNIWTRKYLCNFSKKTSVWKSRYRSNCWSI